MSFVVVCLLVIALLFAVSFFTKRRFGVLGLALAAGAILSEMWVGDITPIIASTGIELVKPPLQSVVAAGLILAPAFLLLLSGPTYKNVSQRLIGSLMFALLATAFLLPPLSSALIIDGVGEPVYRFFADNRMYFVSVGLIFALIDLLMTKTPKAHKKGHE